MSFGYALFVINENGSFKQKIIRDREELEPNEMDIGDEIIAKIPLSTQSLKAFKILDAFEQIEIVTGSRESTTSFLELMHWLIEKSSNVSFALGRELGRKEQANLHAEIEKLTTKKF